MNCSPQPSFNRNFELLADDIRARKKQGYEVFISSSSKEQIERIRNIFKDSSHISEGEHPTFVALESSINEGFISSDVKICLYTDHQIFERYHRVKVRREVERSERLTLEDLSAFHVGDYVVHIDHGVGVFGGLVKTEVNGKHQEAIKIIYKDGDVIFVSVGGLHKISKYKSKDGEPPKIYKLGSGAWNKLKTTTKAKIKDIAKELIELYAKRKGTKGFAFSADSYLQNELEASFIFDDTPDQVKATKAVKADMESENPMDRLICGDVGFGKTEVAIRAAFKAVCDGKQVCVLVPTTILALQHYKTFTERLAEFPCKIDYISRLRTAKDIRQITEDVKEGKTDIIIGTHRLLNKNITFKDLGLLIIDEEQKFGVAAKERLRQLKVEVDTLTLTATPIPRTLQFSLLGARDLSIINTPPPNRLPVETEVIDFNEDYIKEAIESEIKRGGQVFFVHNRVEDILAVEQMINRICPMAKTIVGHGKMEPSLLENRILDFIRGDYDVLISTTIIENGIDIPNANTMIINQAQMFGLSDLHQLRGRVGRSNRRAYCYLIVPPMSSITEDAKRRIKAIEAFSELGSGFNIAMQDLDIRGAGNMLGGEQSGFIADMGFETYQ
ncbi:MAG: transcription-repair coupling factor, partial [Bacteroidales bacterium]|nr:transcription-repair coupling factor [Bacteroidales bacterium]